MSDSMERELNIQKWQDKFVAKGAEKDWAAALALMVVDLEAKYDEEWNGTPTDPIIQAPFASGGYIHFHLDGTMTIDNNVGEYVIDVRKTSPNPDHEDWNRWSS